MNAYQSVNRALLLIAMLGAASAVQARGPQSQPGQFDYYTVAMSWSPSYCATRRDADQCAANSTRRMLEMAHVALGKGIGRPGHAQRAVHDSPGTQRQGCQKQMAGLVIRNDRRPPSHGAVERAPVLRQNDVIGNPGSAPRLAVL